MTDFQWEPLPPRGQRRARRNHQQPTNAPEKESKKPGSTTARRRAKNRPGFNSYLMVQLDTKVVSDLRELTVGLQSKLFKAMDSYPDALSIKPRSLNSLHMTLFFGGETLSALPSSELVDWHSRLSALFTDAGLVPDTGTVEEDQQEETYKTAPSEADNFGFTLREIRLFPPRRNNLVVAILEASPAWHALHGNIRSMTRESEGLRDVLEYSKETWTAHITLANVVTPRTKSSSNNKTTLRILEQLVKDTPLQSEEQQGVLLPRGIAMGGPIPGQQELNWNFRFPHRRQQQHDTLVD